MPLQVAEDRKGKVLVLSPVGRLDSDNAHAFQSIVMGHVEKGERSIVVDFSRLDFISSSGLRVCLVATKTLRASGGRLVLCAMKDSILDVFRISGFARIISIEDSLEAALPSP